MIEPQHVVAEVARLGPIASKISREMVQLMARYTGRGPTRARTTVNSNIVAVVFEDTLTTAEKNLVAAGRADAVLETRRRFAALMRTDAVEIVARNAGREVPQLWPTPTRSRTSALACSSSRRSLKRVWPPPETTGGRPALLPR